MINEIENPNEKNPADEFEGNDNFTSIIESGWETEFEMQIAHKDCVINVVINYLEVDTTYGVARDQKVKIDNRNELSEVPVIHMKIGNDKNRIMYISLDKQTQEFVLEACEYHIMNNSKIFKKVIDL